MDRILLSGNVAEAGTVGFLVDNNVSVCDDAVCSGGGAIHSIDRAQPTDRRCDVVG